MSAITDLLQSPTTIAVVAVVAAIATAVRKAWPWLARLVHLVDDLYGTDARPGVPRRRGVAERLEALEQDMSTTMAAASSAAFHSKPNGGSSAYDAMTRKIDNITQIVSDHVGESKTWVRAVGAALDEHGIDVPPWPKD